MRVVIVKDYDEMSVFAADIVAGAIRDNPSTVLGLPTGGTPVGLYKELVRRYKEEDLDFSKVVTFNIDEYVGLVSKHDQSYHYFMRENFLGHINLDPKHVYILDGMAKDLEAHCKWYEEEIKRRGGIDIQIVGIGADGHIGFNEPGSSLASRTRVKTLAPETIRDNARFFGSEDKVPRCAITMGVGTMLEAKQMIMLSSGKNKAEAVKNAAEGPLTAQVAASVLQFHPRATCVIDEESASLLKRQEYYRYVEKVRRELKARGVDR